MCDSEGQQHLQQLLPTTNTTTSSPEVVVDEEGDEDGTTTLLSLSPDCADSGIGVELDAGGRSIASVTSTGGSDDDDSLSCDCVCSCCCKCREVAIEEDGGSPSLLLSPEITFLSQQYTRLPSLQPPTPLTEPPDDRLSRVPVRNSVASSNSSSSSLSSVPRSRSTTRLEDVVMAAVKRHDDNTMAAIVRRRRRLQLRAKSGEYPLTIPESSTTTLPHDRNNKALTLCSSSSTAMMVQRSEAAASLPQGGVRTLEIKFVW